MTILNYQTLRETCPECHADLRDGVSGTRLVPVVSRYVYRVLLYQCPDCGTTWPPSMVTQEEPPR